jgi:uncharacterized protein (DUF427 family)
MKNAKKESVWDYPRPPALEASSKRIQVWFNSQLIADSSECFRVLETSHPPVYYIPRKDVKVNYLVPCSAGSFCEWKGRAAYFDLKVDGKIAQKSVWTYPEPSKAFAPIKNYLAFYPGPMDYCTVDGEKVQAQAGGFYGGWITKDIEGPFKGEPGTSGW